MDQKNIAYCRFCKNELKDGDVFCEICGRSIFTPPPIPKDIDIEPGEIELESSEPSVHRLDIEDEAVSEKPEKKRGSDPLIGTTVLNQFNIISLIGKGGMGNVYLAEQPSMGRMAAVKALSPSLLNNPILVERFHREAKNASQLNHPNIVTMYNFGETVDGILFIAMEYIEGMSLEDLVRKGPVPIPRALYIVSQICDALNEAHRNHVIHRDLKPDNILLTEKRGKKDFVKILDFGIAKLVNPNESNVSLTQTGVVHGTPIYMSPEQARGEKINHQTDIYSLGVIFYEMITGEIPIKADTPFGFLHAHQTYIPTSPSKVNSEIKIPRSLDKIILKCLEKKIVKRYQTMEEVLSAISKIKVSESEMQEISGRSDYKPLKISTPVGVLNITPIEPFQFGEASEVQFNSGIIDQGQESPDERKLTAIEPLASEKPEESLPKARKGKKGIWLGLIIFIAVLIGATLVLLNYLKVFDGKSSTVTAPSKAKKGTEKDPRFLQKSHQKYPSTFLAVPKDDKYTYIVGNSIPTGTIDRGLQFSKWFATEALNYLIFLKLMSDKGKTDVAEITKIRQKTLSETISFIPQDFKNRIVHYHQQPQTYQKVLQIFQKIYQSFGNHPIFQTVSLIQSGIYYEEWYYQNQSYFYVQVLYKIEKRNLKELAIHFQESYTRDLVTYKDINPVEYWLGREIQGVRIEEIEAESPYQKYAVKKGDTLFGFDATRITQLSDLKKEFSLKGRPDTLEILRNGKKIRVDLKKPQ